MDRRIKIMSKEIKTVYLMITGGLLVCTLITIISQKPVTPITHAITLLALAGLCFCKGKETG
jgi:hypothetical protein